MIRVSFVIGLVLIFVSCTNVPEATIEQPVAVEKINTLESQAKKTSIKVIDTDFSKGRLTNKQEISLWDVQKLHGHLCDGLVVGFLGLREGLYQLYPDSIIDRTNTRIVAKSSPCIGDVGVYLSGGRYQFNSFYVDNAIKGLYVVQRIDNGQTIIIRLKKGIKPAKIDELGAMAVKNELDACSLDSLKVLEDEFSQTLFSKHPGEFFEIEKMEDFIWEPNLNNDFSKTDVLNKNVSQCK